MEARDGAVRQESSTLAPRGLECSRGVSYSPVAPRSLPEFPWGALFSGEASPLFPRETELGGQGLWLRLLGDVKSAGVQAKKEKS